MRLLLSRLLIISFSVVSAARFAAAAESFDELDAARRAGWDTVNILAHSMTYSDAQRFPGMHAWLKEFRAAGGTPGKRATGTALPKLDVNRLSTRQPIFWRAYFEITPGDGGAMLLHAGLLLTAGEVSRAAYVLVAARQSPAIDREMRAAVDSLLEFCQAALGKGAQQVAQAAKLHDSGSPAGAAARLRELLGLWPANALAHYELAIALLAQQYVQAGHKPPPRSRLSIYSEIPPAPAALDAYARARAHDPLLIRAYQGGEVHGGDALLVLGKKVRPLWDQLARETEAKVPNEDLETLANALQEVGIAELALAVRQVLIGREKGYDDQDRRNIAAALKSLAPAAVEPVVARLAAKKPEFIRVILP